MLKMSLSGTIGPSFLPAGGEAAFHSAYAKAWTGSPSKYAVSILIRAKYSWASSVSVVCTLGAATILNPTSSMISNTTRVQGIGNGLPLAAVVTTPEIASVLTSRIHFNTYGGNPVVSAAGQAVLRVLDQEKRQVSSWNRATLVKVNSKTRFTV